jgi:hypothetical protein
LKRIDRLVLGVTLTALIAGGGCVDTGFAQSGAPIFNPQFEQKKKDAAKSRKKLVVPSFTRYIKLMREICQAIATDGRLEDFQKVAGAQPNFSLDCPTCRPFFRIWFSSCQISGTGNLKFSPPEEPTPTPAESPIVPTVPALEESAEKGADESSPVALAEGSATPAPQPTVAPTATETPVPEESEEESEGAEEEEEEEGTPTPVPTPTPRPIVPERDPNIVVIDLVSRLFQSLADGEGAELALMAVDLFVGELRNPAEKSESTRAYFDTLSEYMLAPFESIRGELIESIEAQGEAGEGSAPQENVDQMFDF